MYSYITENNLENKQHYMFSKYSGIDFLDEFIQVRTKLIHAMQETFLPAYKSLLIEDLHKWGGYLALIDRLSERSIIELKPAAAELPLVQCPIEMKAIDLGSLESFHTPDLLESLIAYALSAVKLENDEPYVRLLNALTKSFEVRKRLYEAYSKEFKPLSANYQTFDSYAKFSLVLSVAYLKTNNLKYLNALLKINDTISSISKEFNESPQTFMMVYLSLLIERYAIQKLCVSKGLSL